MNRKLILLTSLILVTLMLAGCGTAGTGSGGDYDTITIVWYPNESGNDLKDARDALGSVVAEATGKAVEHQLTTDYSIAIEAIANDKAHLAFMGAQGYVEANIKNKQVLPLVVPSGKSGTLEDAVYYSWLIVRKGEEGPYLNNGQYTIDEIQGKRFSFVSNSSTSGFKVPSASIISYFSKEEAWKDLTGEDLLEGGSGKFFQEVLYGGSHQGSGVNLLTNKADVAAVCDTCVGNYIELASGEANRPGAVYRVKADAAEPFNTLVGEEFVIISVTPVLNAPFVVNTGVLSVADQEAVLAAFTSEEVANNTQIFVPADSDFAGLFAKTADERFVKVEDSWFDPVRELSN